MKSSADRIKNIERPIYRSIRDYANSLGYRDLIYLNIGEPDAKTPEHIVEVAKRAMDAGFTHYSEDRGFLDLRQAIADEIETTRRVEVDPRDAVVVTGGSTEANAASLLALVNPGEEVLLPDPCYGPYIYIVRLAGAEPVFVPINKETLEWDSGQLEQYVTDKTKLIMVNSPNNPTGGVFSHQSLREISQVAKDHDLFVLSDEVYDAFIYEDARFESITQFDPALERTILTNSLSKTFAMTGWRVGYLVSNAQIASDILKVKGIVDMCASAISQKAALAALQGSRECVKQMLDEYAARRKIVVEGLSKLPKTVCPAPKGAFYAFPDVSAFEKDSFELAKRIIREAHVVTSPGKAFGPSGEGHIRMSYANSRKDLREALARMEIMLKKYA